MCFNLAGKKANHPSHPLKAIQTYYIKIIGSRLNAIIILTVLVAANLPQYLSYLR
jgi:hypothetical protein